jgi:hypothetical protein
MENNKFGIIDKRGNWKIEPILDEELRNFWNLSKPIKRLPLSIVSVNRKYGILDQEYNWIVNPEYYFLEYVKKNTFMAAMNDSKYGFFSTELNDWLIKPIFDYKGGYGYTYG